MKRNNYIIIILGLICSLLYSQYDEKKVLTRQARTYEMQRNYQRANEIYEKLLIKFPDDSNIIHKVITNLIIMNKVEDAEKELKRNAEILTDLQYIDLQIFIILKTGKPDEALVAAQGFIQKDPGNVGYYHSIAEQFERTGHHDYAITIIQQARKVTNDDYLFTLEIARNYENNKQFSQAAIEYMKHLKKNRGYFHYVSNKVKSLLNSDSEIIRNLENFVKSNDMSRLQEVYAHSLAHLKRYDEALQIYAKLQPDKLFDFAKSRAKAGDFTVAIESYRQFITAVKDPIKQAEANLEIAKIEIDLNNLDSGYLILNELIKNEIIQNKKNRFKTKVNQESRIILADLALREKKYDQAFEFLRDAQNFTYNQKEKKDIDFKIVYYYLLNEDFDKAKTNIKQIIGDEESGSEISNKAYYYQYLLYSMLNEAKADTMLNELIISAPGYKNVNDILYLSTFLSNFDENTKEKFWQSFRMKGKYFITSAVDTLISLSKETQNENFKILAADWALNAGFDQIAYNIYSETYTDSLLNPYAELQRIALTDSTSKHQEDIIEFLKKEPDHILAPSFRQYLTNIN